MPAVNANQVEEDREKAINLFTFLRELVALRSKIVRSLESYEAVIWFHEVPREPECRCAAWHLPQEGEEVDYWLEVHKPKLLPVPPLPEDLEPWVDPELLKESSQDFPPIRERVLAGDPEREEEPREVDGYSTPEPEAGPRFIELEEVPEIRAQWERYIESQWWPWAEMDRKQQAVQKIYTKLFTLYHEQKELGESFEVVLGLGQLRWRVPSGQEANRHLICAQTSLEFDAARGLITVGPAAEGANPILEQDMLDPENRPSPDIQLRVEKMVSSLGDDLWHNEQVEACLKAWVHSVAMGRGEYDNSLEPNASADDTPCVRLAPALILRRRTERGFLQLYREILEDLENREDVPEGLVSLVRIVEEKDTVGEEPPQEGHSDSYVGEEDFELYFPLPSNREQREIVRRLHGRRGVVVQGPPGTGKSHTIANLVCHLLANGKRVLVTSHTPRALRVLKGKLPKSITDLCVILLGNDRKALDELESSVLGITQALNNWSAEAQAHKISETEDQLHCHRATAARIEKELRALREADTYRHPPMFGSYEGTLQQIAVRLRSAEDQLGWLSPYALDDIPVDTELGLSNEEGQQLLDILCDIDGERELQLDLIQPESLPDAETMLRLIEEEQAVAHRLEEAKALTTDFDHTAILNADEDLARALAGKLEELLSKYEELETHVHEWVRKAAIDAMGDQDQPWRVLLQETSNHVEAIEQHGDAATELTVEGQAEVEFQTLREDARAVLEHLEAGGRLRTWFRRPQVVKEREYIIRDVRAGGRPCTTVNALRALWAWADTQHRIESLRRLWSDVTTPPAGAVPKQLATYRDLCEPIEAALELHELVGQCKQLVRQIPDLPSPTWHKIEELKILRAALITAELARQLAQLRRRIAKVEKRLATVATSGSPHGVIKRLQQAISARDSVEYKDAFEELVGIWRDRNRLAIRDVLLDRLRSIAPSLVKELLDHRERQRWENKLPAIIEAWNWHRAERWLTACTDPGHYRKQVYALDRVREAISECLEQLAALKGWSFCMGRMTKREETFLKAWMTAIKRIGAGTGKRAARFRKVARENLEECRSAIPAWIMPIYRVAETVRPGEDLFDVVIVDEASQSGMEALFLHYIGRQVIVVGDDNQIAPSNIGINRDDVELLRRRYIADIPLSNFFDLDNSFFDQAHIRFGDRIRLREHFRCMPEIIQFSNNLCYRNEPLVPLRQYGDERLEPVVGTSYVGEGYQEGRTPNVVNRPEAEAIVERINVLCADGQYVDKTMGVISLLGQRQAKLIEQMLLETIGPEEMEKRRLTCGDAYSFQGDERDVMFLSLVSAPTEGHRIGVLSDDESKRRFNVAASRAKDQMFLFHSVGLDDLSPRCLRRGLLDYCLHPAVEQDTLEGIDIGELRLLARNADRAGQRPPLPFESWFEVDVFLRIHGRGFRVLPQHDVAGYRIDLVVAGMKGRMAVECDGEEWHGAERYEDDMGRQRQIERCGWRFWRIRGGEFYRDPDRAMEGLWELLDALGIHPSEGSSQPGGKQAEAESSSGGSAAGAATAGSFDDADEMAHREHSAATRPAQVALPEESSSTSVKQADEAPTVAGAGATERHGDDRGSWQLRAEPPPQARLFPSTSDQPAVPDPRTAKPAEVRDALVDIVVKHGPMPCHYAYRIYAQRVGIQRIRRPVRRLFNRCIATAVRNGELEESNEYGTKDQLSRVVRRAGSPLVRHRPRGDRNLEDIPPSEIADTMELIVEGMNDAKHDQELLFRKVLDYYGLRRLTEKARNILCVAWTICQQRSPA